MHTRTTQEACVTVMKTEHFILAETVTLLQMLPPLCLISKPAEAWPACVSWHLFMVLFPFGPHPSLFTFLTLHFNRLTLTLTHTHTHTHTHTDTDTHTHIHTHTQTYIHIQTHTHTHTPHTHIQTHTHTHTTDIHSTVGTGRHHNVKLSCPRTEDCAPCVQANCPDTVDGTLGLPYAKLVLDH